MAGAGALGESCDLCRSGLGLDDEDALADVDWLDVNALVAATAAALDELGSSTPFLEAEAKLEDAAFESIVR